MRLSMFSLCRIIQSTKMSGKNPSISLNCSLATPAPLTTATPNTPSRYFIWICLFIIFEMSKAAEKPLTEPYSKTYKPVSLYITNLDCSSLECLTICSTSTSTRHISLTTKCLSTGTCVAYGLLLAELYATCGQVSILTKNTGQNRASLIPERMARFSG